MPYCQTIFFVFGSMMTTRRRLVALLLAALTTGSYAELVTKYPKAGGAALYVKRAFGSRLLAFLVAFTVMASGVTRLESPTA
jgi:APA family basic amino acid/polyamine antiporter